MPILHLSAVLGRTPPTKYSQGFFGFFKGWPKNREKPVFFGCLMCGFLFSISSPHGHLSSWQTFLLANVSFILASLLFVLCFPSFRWLCFLVSIHPYFLLGSFFFIWLFVFLVFSFGGTETQMKPQNISKFWLSSSASVPASPHFHLAQIITLLGQEKNLSKNLFFVAFLLGLVAMCWNTYFYCVFTHHPNFAYKMGPKKNDNVSQNAKQESVF